MVLADLNLVIYGTIYMYAVEISEDFNLAVERHTAKSPNLIPRQIFRPAIYGGMNFWSFHFFA